MDNLTRALRSNTWNAPGVLWTFWEVELGGEVIARYGESHLSEARAVENARFNGARVYKAAYQGDQCEAGKQIGLPTWRDEVIV